MSRAALAAGVVATASLGVNAYLVLARRAPPAPRPVETEVVAPPRPSLAPREPTLPATDLAQLDRAALERRLLEAEARLDALLPPKDRYDHSEPAPEVEARVRPVVDKVFDGRADSYELECHGAICKVTPKAGAPDDWIARIQNTDRFVFEGHAFSGEGDHATVATAAVAAGRTWRAQLHTALFDAAAFAECKARNPAPGELFLRLAVDDRRRHVEVTASGALASQASGICIRRVLEDMIAASPPPPEVTAVPDGPFRVTIP